MGADFKPSPWPIGQLALNATGERTAKDAKVLSLATRAVHAGEPERRPGAPITTPVYHSSMFLTGELGRYDDISYIRSSNMPSHTAVARKLADLEGAEAGLVTASGMAAIVPSLLVALGRGGHLIAQNTLYGVIFTYLAFILPFSVWTLRGFVANIPKDLEEAAMIDGCSRFKAFMRVTFPLIAPGLVAPPSSRSSRRGTSSPSPT